ncbi:MAG: bifunctional demethylmenaquinone methyltransferase/2-methoxy-6-polyprenyl-1,4-benzoquinol methylase UbiE [Chlamydiales bacterium]|nr:bifunctional demethylmenaquinone methyltransferase/2-methoxy-6-polyprenyl-1,4-benzoquinol methylase UbiE [Chlamydiales bacterium]
MFDAISPTYDTVNRVMTGGIDRRWRRELSSLLPSGDKLSLLDCATGTGDQLFSLMESSSTIATAVGIDLAQEMLKYAASKLETKPYKDRVQWIHASASDLPFAEATFDCLTISFGIRNVDDLSKSLQEFRRVLKSGGRLLILETSLPKNPLIRSAHLFYIRHLLPKIGGWLSKNRAAYVYLNKSAEAFPCGESFCSILREAGFKNVRAHPQTFGAVTIYQADK